MPSSPGFNSTNKNTSKKQAVLFLFPPPPPWTSAEWYWKKIAGVPLLLRNILTLQRGGVDQITLFSKHLDGVDRNFLQRISGDRRVTIKITWATDADKLADHCGPAGTSLALDGSVLYDSKELNPALQSIGEGIIDRAPYSYREFDSVALDSLWEESERPNMERLARASHPQDRSTLISDGQGKCRFLLLPQGEQGVLSSEADVHHQEERLLNTCGLNSDSFMDRKVTRHVSRQLTRWFLPTSLTPNQITALSFLLGLGSAWLFLQANYWIGVAGAMLLLVSAWIDCTDGEIARLKFMESKWGGFFDIVSDNIVHWAVFFSMGWGLYHSTGREIFKLLGGLAVFGSMVSFMFLCSQVVESKSQSATPRETKRPLETLVNNLANRDFTYFLLVMALIDQLGIFLFLTAVGSNIFAVILIFLKIKMSIQTKKS